MENAEDLQGTIVASSRIYRCNIMLCTKPATCACFICGLCSTEIQVASCMFYGFVPPD